jgi:hypothetical protein
VGFGEDQYKVFHILDPYKWTKRQTQNWLCWLREANDLDELDITEFNVDGAGLCGLSPQLVSVRQTATLQCDKSENLGARANPNKQNGMTNIFHLNFF